MQVYGVFVKIFFHDVNHAHEYYIYGYRINAKVWFRRIIWCSQLKTKFDKVPLFKKGDVLHCHGSLLESYVLTWNYEVQTWPWLAILPPITSDQFLGFKDKQSQAVATTNNLWLYSCDSYPEHAQIVWFQCVCDSPYILPWLNDVIKLFMWTIVSNNY